MKKIIILILLVTILSSCEKTYNIKYRVTFNNGDTQTFNENWSLSHKPDGVYLSSEKGENGCVKACPGCVPSACGVRTVETLSVTEIKSKK